MPLSAFQAFFNKTCKDVMEETCNTDNPQIITIDEQRCTAYRVTEANFALWLAFINANENEPPKNQCGELILIDEGGTQHLRLTAKMCPTNDSDAKLQENCMVVSLINGHLITSEEVSTTEIVILLLTLLINEVALMCNDIPREMIEAPNAQQKLPMDDPSDETGK